MYISSIYGSYGLRPRRPSAPGPWSWLTRVMAIPVAIIVVVLVMKAIGNEPEQPIGSRTDFTASQQSQSGPTQPLDVPTNVPTDQQSDWPTYQSENLPFSLRYPTGWTLSPVIYVDAPSGPQESFFIANATYASAYNNGPLEATVSGAIKIDVYYASLAPTDPFTDGTAKIVESFSGKIGGLPANIVVWNDTANDATGFTMRLEADKRSAIYCSAMMGTPGSTEELGEAWSTCESIQVRSLH